MEIGTRWMIAGQEIELVAHTTDGRPIIADLDNNSRLYRPRIVSPDAFPFPYQPR